MDLIADGLEPGQHLRFTLNGDSPCILGRAADVDVCIPWDPRLSRRHAELALDGEVLEVRRFPGASNPIFHGGRAVESCRLRTGDQFVAGNTKFVVADGDQTASPPRSQRPFEEVTFSREALQQVRFRDPDRRIEVLSHLPEVIWGTRSDTELHTRLVNLLLAGISKADAAGVVLVEPSGEMRVLQWDRRRETAGAFRPSVRLVVEAVARRRQSVLHIWESSEQSAEFTATREFDWAFCTPVPGAPAERWGLYLGGRFEQGSTDPARDSRPVLEGQLQADVKFAELVAEIVGSIRKLNHLERQQAGLRQFLPPAILAVIGDNSDTSLLVPRESQVTVMFCDLRGFSRQAESAQGRLAELLDRVSQALGVMTRHISRHGGVIGDFQGDSAMGFWGWPVAQDDDALEACRAALAIRAEFAEATRSPGHPLADFRVGLGLAHGKAVAGRIGTGEHFVFTAFGPVVNLASRLEGMTKPLRVPILIDETLAEIVRTRMPADEGRTRHLARVLPFGLDTPLLVSELVPSTAQWPELTAEHLAAYDRAVDHFTAGRWDEAYAELRTLPPGDRAQDFLALHIAQHNRVAPPEWSGVIKLPSK